MKWLILLVSSLAIVYSRPQSQESLQNAKPSIELEKQTIVELKPVEKYENGQLVQGKVEADTKEILAKIAEVNKKQGLRTRKQKPNYFNFPFNYSRSKEGGENDESASGDFKFPTNPFSNPIFDYLERQKQKIGNVQSRYGTNDNRQMPEQSMTSSNFEVGKVDDIPGQYIKRKIMHQQTLLIPNPNLMTPFSGQPDLPPYEMQNRHTQPLPNVPGSVTNGQKNLSNLEKQTVDNVKTIVSNTQMLKDHSNPAYFNQYLQYPNGHTQNQGVYGLIDPNKNYLGEISNEGYNYHVYGPFSASNSEKGRQSWNWPGSGYFPIYIRDPFVQMYNAITTMVEYGPNAGQTNPCADRPAKSRSSNKPPLREGKTTEAMTEEGTKISVELDSPHIAIREVDENVDKNSATYLDIENIDIGANKDNTMKFTISLKKEEREGKDTETMKSSWDRIRVSGKSSTSVVNNTRTSSKYSEKPKDTRPSSILKPLIKQTVMSPPNRDPTHQTVEFGDESEEEEKSEEIISNDHNKKMFSRDNTGSGVFIHKLKVRKGGVAIAGPGGIATAGSGGTAIVGPNGVAYTHPDSLAIAGSGTKVVAVDPAVNLVDLVNNSTGVNRTRLDGFPSSRIGKVVAVGPVIYYNKG